MYSMYVLNYVCLQDFLTKVFSIMIGVALVTKQVIGHGVKERMLSITRI